MRRLGAIAIVLALAGCGEDAQQQAAREETQAFVSASATAAAYDVAETHCTNSARTAIFRIEETATFVCAVRRIEGGCDWFRVDVERQGPRVRLSDPDAGCVLPE
ncbi:MAG: hypothetical protein H0V45_15365 [Actinobacteria bacterium]|nr:hypothetical protein [Actinomycetota bacterium]